MSPSPDPTPPTRPPPGVRWWPAAVIVALVLARCLQVAYFRDIQRQYKVMGIALALTVGTGLLLAWLLAFSRLRWRTRWRCLGAFLGALVLAAAAFRYEGVTGDLVPIFEPRWRPRAAAATLRAATTNGPNAAPSLPAAVAAQAFPQFLGPARDGTVPGSRLARDWTRRPPERLWRQPIGEGWGGFALVGDRAITQEQAGTNESVTCYELATGRRLWTHSDPARYDNPLGGVGPRATPTVAGNRVFTLGATGWLNCLDLADGRVLWSTNVVGPVGPEALEWGCSSSPLVCSNVVVVAPRGAGDRSLAAYDLDTGGLAWTGGTRRPHYSSPRLVTLLGVPQILTFTGAAASHDPRTGALLWEYPWRGGHPHVTDPRAIGTNRVLVSSGYGTGSHLVEIGRDDQGGWTATNTLWRSIRLKSKFANILLHDGFAYGLDDGRLVCLDLADGSRRWDGERYGHGQLLLVDDVILLTAENGDVVLVDRTPEEFRELTRFRAVDGKTWNPPALAGDILVVRNDREAAAYRLPLAP